MNVCPYALLDCSNGTLNITDMVVLGSDIKVDWSDVVANTFKISVPVNMGNVETTTVVILNDLSQEREHYRLGSGGHVGNSAEH